MNWTKPFTKIDDLIKSSLYFIGIDDYVVCVHCNIQRNSFFLVFYILSLKKIVNISELPVLVKCD